METIFISYSHKDGKWVRDWLLPRLESVGLRVHIDFRDFEIGLPSIINMEKAVEECQWTFLILTPHWVESQWTNFESFILQTGDPTNLKKRMFPLMLKKCDLPRRLSIFTYADFTDENNWEAQLSRLLGQMGFTYSPGAVVSKAYVRPAEESITLLKLPVTGKEFLGREKQLAFLHAAWADAHTHLVTLVAWGGVGKTALVNEWLNQMETNNYHGAQKVYGWSFYSQGAEEGKQASADEFFQETLAWFGDTNPQAGSAVDKGRRLARLVRKQKTLLILDGLEPLQYPPGEIHGFDGKLKDQGMAAFLKELAVGHVGETGQPGLCVITTREEVTDLQHKLGYGVKEVKLEHLSEATGVALLKNLGVTTGSEKDFKEAAAEYDRHALALTLLGQYIKAVHNGDIRKRDKMPRLTKERLQGKHARKVMEAYEMWFGDSPERNILYLLGLFDRPVEKGAVEELKKEPAIPGVTDQLQRLPEDNWQEALTNLRSANLLAEQNPQKPGTLDCHPLVREHFGEKLRHQNPKGWKAAHKRLYNYFKKLPEKELPDTLQEMEPLFAAVAHGCKAGLHQKLWEDIIHEKINRVDKMYTVKILGAFGSHLSALSHFFEIPWSQPAEGLTDSDKSLLLSWAAFDLRAVGRLQEAIQPMKTGLELGIQQKNWEGAAVRASNLSALMLTLGEVTEAVAYARQSVTHADRSGDDFMKESRKTALADALHQAGQMTEAEKWFREAEEKQKKRQPEYPFLYSLPGFWYCDLLLGQGKANDVMERADKTLEWLTKAGVLLPIALDQLSLGRAWMLKTVQEKSGDFSPAMDFMDQAVEGLRKASRNDHLPRALFARAECYRRMRSYSKAMDDLNEAKEIAELGSMKLFLCDYHLEAGKLCQEQKGKEKEAEEHFKIAADMVEKTKYHRRKLQSPGGAPS